MNPREIRDTVEDVAVRMEKVTVENRASRRIALKTAVHLESASNFYTGFSRNLSEGGLFVATYNQFPLGTVVNLEFSLADEGPPISVQGEVRWSSDPTPDGDGHVGLGLQFVDLAEGDRQRIERFVSQRDTIFYD